VDAQVEDDENSFGVGHSFEWIVSTVDQYAIDHERNTPEEITYRNMVSTCCFALTEFYVGNRGDTITFTTIDEADIVLFANRPELTMYLFDVKRHGDNVYIRWYTRGGRKEGYGFQENGQTFFLKMLMVV